MKKKFIHKQSSDRNKIRDDYARRHKQINFIVCNSDYEEIMKIAERDGFFKTVKRETEYGKVKVQVPTPAILARAATLAYIKKSPLIPPALITAVLSLNLEIRKVGNLINRSVKIAHSKIKKHDSRKTKYRKKKPVNVEKEMKQVLYNLWILEKKIEQFTLKEMIDRDHKSNQ